MMVDVDGYVPDGFTVISTSLPTYGQTKSGYGSKMPTSRMIVLPEETRRRRVYAMCYSNVASHYIITFGKRLFIGDWQWPAWESSRMNGELHNLFVDLKGGQEDEQVKDEIEYCVQIDDLCESNLIPTIKAVRGAMKSLGLKEAKDLVDGIVHGNIHTIHSLTKDQAVALVCSLNDLQGRALLFYDKRS